MDVRPPVQDGPFLPKLARLLISAALLLGAVIALVLFTTRREPANPLASAPLAPWTSEPIQPLIEVPSLDAAKVALGRKLFEDRRLSGRNNLPCAACHDVGSNGSLSGNRTTRFDTPTVFNSVLSSRLGWQGMEWTLEQQALATIKSPMVSQGVPLQTMIDRLAQDSRLRREFAAIYDRSIDIDGVVDAIAYYERSLVTPGSRFDLWLAGNNSAMNEQALRGYKRFKQLGCVSCHQGQNVGGNLLQKHGIFRPLATPEPRILRVPSLRNVATTAPYFHDGSARTLDQAVKKMAASQLNVDLKPQEVVDLVAFLNTLTGNYAGQKVRAPE